MHLKTWMKLNSVTQTRMSNDLKVRQATLSLILSGKYKVKPELAAAIEDYTSGEVTRMDLLYPEETLADIDPTTGTPLTKSLQKELLSRLKAL